MDPADWRRTDVFFIRHGESANNCIYDTVRSKFGDALTGEQFEAEMDRLHDPDCGLSPRGQQQTECLRQHLKAYSLCSTLHRQVQRFNKFRLFCSPMKRCLLTTAAVADGLGVQTTVHPLLFESDGCYQPLCDGSTKGLPGMSASEVEQSFPHFLCLSGMENGWYHHAEKETSHQFQERVKILCDWLWSVHNDDESGHEGPIVLSTHGNVIRGVISSLLHSSMLIASCNTGISHIQLWSRNVDGRRLVSIQYLNRVDHLLHDSSLLAGSDVFGDHWIQEYVEN